MDLAVKKKATAAGQAGNGQTAGTEKEQKFSKEQLVASARYGHRKDLVSILLEDSRAYTIAEVDRLVEEFMKGKVK